MTDESSLRGTIHDLSNALTVILGWAEQARGQERELQERALGIIEACARSAHGLARRSIGAQWNLEEQAEIGAACERLTQSLALAAEARSIRIELELGAYAHETIDGASWFEQVLQNLLLNAIAFSPVGASVRLELGAADQHWLIRVVDHGSGVAASARDRLFLPGHSTREGGGGLGLSHSKRIAESLGGSLELESSEPGRGSVFLLRWRRDAGVRPPSEPLAGQTVIMVEDDDSIVELLSLALTARGARLRRAQSPSELVAQVAEGCLAVALDWSPIAEDPEAWAQVLAPIVAAHNVIVVTGQPERVSLRGVGVLVKPFEVKEFLQAVIGEPLSCRA